MPRQKRAYSKRQISNLWRDGGSRTILFGMAKGPWAIQWANQQEEKGRSFSGQDIYELAPDPPSAAVKWAEDIAAQIKRLNGGKSLIELYHVAIEAGFNKNSEMFGMYLGCQASGEGIAWDDDLSGAGDLISVPSREFYV